MMWLKSAILIPSSGCIGRPRTGDPAALLDAAGDLPRIDEHRGSVDIESGQRCGVACRILLVQIIEAPLIGGAEWDELHSLSAPLGLARANGVAGLVRQRRLPNRDRRLEHSL